VCVGGGVCVCVCVCVCVYVVLALKYPAVVVVLWLTNSQLGVCGGTDEKAIPANTTRKNSCRSGARGSAKDGQIRTRVEAAGKESAGK